MMSNVPQLVSREGRMEPGKDFTRECEKVILFSLKNRGVLDQVQLDECLHLLLSQR